MPPLLAPSAFARIGHLASERRVHQAFRFLHLNDGRFMDWQRRIASIPAPPFGEAARAAWLAEEFRALGLEQVHTDAEGNVLASLPSRQPTGVNKAVVISAHIDTVFPADTPLDPQVQRQRLVAPGACDNAAGMTGMLAIAAALCDADLRLGCDLVFVGNTGEEGEGDLRGMRHLYADEAWRSRVEAHLVLDGAGCEVAVTEALGSRRFLVTLLGRCWSA
jgi:tripeptide aminopeptidase